MTLQMMKQPHLQHQVAVRLPIYLLRNAILQTPIHLQQDKEEEMEEDFQTVPLDDNHWADEQIPNRPLCIHSHLLQHELCTFQCPYEDYLTSSYLNELALSDISEF